MRILMLALALCACASVDVDRAMRAGTIATSGLIACDVGQTYYASNGGKWDRQGDGPNTLQLEKNPLLGPRPSPSTLAAVAFIAITANTLVGMSELPAWARGAYLVTVGSVEGYIVAKHVRTAGACGIAGTP